MVATVEEIPKIEFQGKILLIGFGGVGRSMLPALLKHFSTRQENITVIEKDDSSEYFATYFKNTKVNYEIVEIVRSNMEEVLSKYVGEGDLIINLSLNVDGIDTVKWCLEHGVLYIDTSIERWTDEPDESLDLASRTLYNDHQLMRKMTSAYEGGPTCVAAHGANPGLVSHFVKQALLDMVNELSIKVKIPQTKRGWAKLMQLLGVKVIHISERDTQAIDQPKKKNEFVNTWSCEGFWAEGRAPAEIGWGTHEPELPKHAFEHKEGPKNSIYFEKPGVSLMCKSWVPRGGEFNGLVVQHSEAITISDYFTVFDGDKPVYRPTVHYAYCPCDAALVSVHEFKGKELALQDSTRIAKDEIVSGIDELGVLLMGDRLSWWYGSQLGIKESRKLIPHQNATTLQVIASMLGALAWMIENPKEGYKEAEDLPYDFVLDYAMPYLGPVRSMKTQWKPTANVNKLYRKTIDHGNPWAFSNFRVY